MAFVLNLRAFYVDIKRVEVWMLMAVLMSLGIANAGVEPMAYTKIMHCGFKVKNEKHSFYIYSDIFGGPIWVAFREALYSSYLSEIHDPKDLKKLPMTFDFRVGEMPDGQWQGHIMVTLETLEEKNNKRVRVGKINILNRDGKLFTAPIRCR